MREWWRGDTQQAAWTGPGPGFNHRNCLTASAITGLLIHAGLGAELSLFPLSGPSFCPSTSGRCGHVAWWHLAALSVCRVPFCRFGGAVLCLKSKRSGFELLVLLITGTMI